MTQKNEKSPKEAEKEEVVRRKGENPRRSLQRLAKYQPSTIASSSETSPREKIKEEHWKNHGHPEWACLKCIDLAISKAREECEQQKKLEVLAVKTAWEADRRIIMDEIRSGERQKLIGEITEAIERGRVDDVFEPMSVMVGDIFLTQHQWSLILESLKKEKKI